MNLQEAIKDLRSRVKPYLHIGMKESTYFNTLRNIEAGLAKQETISAFFQKFGYEVDVKMEINKI